MLRLIYPRISRLGGSRVSEGGCWTRVNCLLLGFLWLGEIDLWQLFWDRSVQILNGALYLGCPCVRLLNHPIHITLRSFRLRLLQLRVAVGAHIPLISPTPWLIIRSSRVIIRLRLRSFMLIRRVHGRLHKFLAAISLPLIVNQPVQVVIRHLLVQSAADAAVGPMAVHSLLPRRPHQFQLLGVFSVLHRVLL